MTTQKYWAACETIPGREHKVRSEIEKSNRGAFLPTYQRIWSSDGKLSSRERPLVPGYVFFLTLSNNWGEVDYIDGVQGVLTVGERAKKVSESEMSRMVLAHATGSHDEIDANIIRQRNRDRKKSRKPRPGKRIRKATAP